MSSQATSFGLIRHAATLWNEKKMIQGRLDSPLSGNGRKMAAEWGRSLASFSWQRIICSDLGRTRATAELINHTLKLPVHPDRRFREQDWGEWSGRTLAEVKKHHKKQLSDLVRNGWAFRPPGGESRTEVLARSLAALHEAHTTWPGESILVVCHEGIIKCLLYHLSGRQFLPEEPRLINKGYQLHLLEHKQELIIKELNYTSL
jgi:probable phosphoglycerate mutase